MKIQRTSASAGWSGVETFFTVALVAIITLTILCAYHREKVVMPEAYQAWVKQTGNTNQLTYEEWRSLMRANEKQNTQIILIPH